MHDSHYGLAKDISSLINMKIIHGILAFGERLAMYLYPILFFML